MEVCIKKDENGQFSVGVEPDEATANPMMGGEGMQQEASEGRQMNPAKDLEDALNQARQLLSSGEDQSQSDMWNKVQRDRAMANQPGGPMMGR